VHCYSHPQKYHPSPTNRARSRNSLHLVKLTCFPCSVVVVVVVIKFINRHHTHINTHSPNIKY
jgi:hypothetical protein